MKHSYLKQNKNVLMFKIGLILLLLLKFNIISFGETNIGRENPGNIPVINPPVVPQTDPDVKTRNNQITTTDKSSEVEFKSSSYPNPFVASTMIEFQSNQDGNASLEIFSITGSKVADLFNDKILANTLYKVNWDAANFPAGIYFYRIVYGEKLKSGRLILSK